MATSFLAGGFIQRVDAGAVGGRDTVLLRVRVPGETATLLLVGGSGGRVALLSGEAKEGAKAVLRAADDRRLEARLRPLLEGAKVTAIASRAVALVRDEQAWRLEARGRGELAITETAGAPLEPWSREELEEGGAALVALLGTASLGATRERLARALGKAIDRLARRIAAVRGDLARIAVADELAARAQLFVAEASRAPRGATKLLASDWSSGAEVRVELALDPAKSAREQIDAMFKRARRLKEGARIGEARLAEALTAMRGLTAVLDALPNAPDLVAIAALTARARAAAPKDFREAGGAQDAGRAKRRAEPRPPFRLFIGSGEARILVGRGADHNDDLTFHVARPHDLWLHAKGRAGAHVIVPLAKGASCPADLLVDAAHLAAHFSEAREETVTEVEYTPRRYLRKPRGSAPGFVVVSREKVIVLRREAARAERLLAAERDAADPASNH